MNSVFASACSASLIALSSFAATTYYVDGRTGKGSDDWDGLTPETAKATIHAGVLKVTEAGDTVSVAPATYHITSPITNVSVGTSIKSFNLIAQSSNPRETVIDGGGTTMCVYFRTQGNTIAGFTVTNGYADASSGFNTVGGAGIRLDRGNVVSNCIVTCCRSVGAGLPVNGGGVYGVGGAIAYAYDQLVVENCSILSTSGNKWLRGGGLYNLGPGFMRNCIVRNCELKVDGGTTGVESAIGGGAAVEANTAGGLKVSGCQFVDNLITNTVAGDFGDGGGLYMTCGDVVQSVTYTIGLEDSLIANNRCSYYGAGLYLNGVAVSGITVSNNVSFAANNQSGGVYAKKSSCTTASICSSIISSFIVDNQAKNGGAGIFMQNDAAIVSNCLFRGNNKQAVYVQGGQAGSLVTHCRFENDVGGEIGGGGVLDLTVADCTFSNVGQKGCGAMVSVTANKTVSGDYLKVRNCRFSDFSGNNAVNLYTGAAHASSVFDACTFANITNTRYQTFWIQTAGCEQFVTLKNLLFAGTAATSTSTTYANPDIPAAFDSYPGNLVCNKAVSLSKLKDPAAGDFRPRKSAGTVNAGSASAWMDGALDMGTGTFTVEKLGTWGVELVKNEAHARCVGERPDIGCCEYWARSGLLLLFK